MNAERDPFLIRDDPVEAGKFFIARDGLINDRDFVPVNLLGSEQRPITDSNLAANIAMNGVEPLQRLGFVM
jgi:hypothetical protein